MSDFPNLLGIIQRGWAFLRFAFNKTDSIGHGVALKVLLGGTVVATAHGIWNAIYTGEYFGVAGFIFSRLEQVIGLSAPTALSYIDQLYNTEGSFFSVFSSMVNFHLWMNCFFNIVMPVKIMAIMFGFLARGLKFIASIISGLI